jgi:LysM repeat protein
MKTIKIPRLFKTKKMRAATARRASAASTGMEFEGIPEPNMKLSRALLIVLLLHVVAVSGIIAFNAIKTRENSFVPPVSEETDNKPAESTRTVDKSVAEKPRTATAQNQGVKQTDLKPLHSPVKEEHAKTPMSSGKTYVVRKGDNPVTIAKKLKVSYTDLMGLNHIEDPRKLQIGQKLLIPEKTNSKTTSAKSMSQKKSKK